MKKIKIILFAVVLGTIASCSSDNDNSATTPTTIAASGTIDWSSFQASNTNITSLATINGVAAQNYTSTVIKGDKLTFAFNTGAKISSVKVTRELVFLYIDVDSPKVADEQFLSNITYIRDPNQIDFDGNLGFEIGEGAPEDYDGKYNMYFTVLEDGVRLPDLYVIDPKIKIRGSR